MRTTHCDTHRLERARDSDEIADVRTSEVVLTVEVVRGVVARDDVAVTRATGVRRDGVVDEAILAISQLRGRRRGHGQLAVAELVERGRVRKPVERAVLQGVVEARRRLLVEDRHRQRVLARRLLH